jgi:hypothetical protein
MKLRVLVVSLVALGLSASIAIAAPPPGKGKPTSPGNSATAGKPLPTGATCKPKVTVVLKGTVDSSSTGSLSVDVTSANRWGRAYVPGTVQVTVTPETKVRRNGNTTPITGLLPGEWVLVQARACKGELTGTPLPTPALTAVRVVAHPVGA